MDYFDRVREDRSKYFKPSFFGGGGCTSTEDDVKVCPTNDMPQQPLPRNQRIGLMQSFLESENPTNLQSLTRMQWDLVTALKLVKTFDASKRTQEDRKKAKDDAKSAGGKVLKFTNWMLKTGADFQHGDIDAAVTNIKNANNW
jgi:hypothetical protein